MKTTINWNKTSEGLPEPTVGIAMAKTPKGKQITKEIAIDDECLVIWQGKVKRSRYLSDQKRWEGHLENQVPEYWVKIKDLEIEE